MQFLIQPTVLKQFFVFIGLFTAFRLPIAQIVQQGENSFCRQHCRFHRRVRALNARYIQKTRAIANQRAACKRQMRQTLQTAFHQRPRSIRHAPPAFQHFADGRMQLPALQFFKGREIGIGVIQPNHHAQRNLVVVQMVNKRAAISALIQRITHRVLHAPRVALLGRHFPYLFDAQAISLRLAIAV